MHLALNMHIKAVSQLHQHPQQAAPAHPTSGRL